MFTLHISPVSERHAGDLLLPRLAYGNRAHANRMRSGRSSHYTRCKLSSCDLQHVHFENHFALISLVGLIHYQMLPERKETGVGRINTREKEREVG